MIRSRLRERPRGQGPRAALCVRCWSSRPRPASRARTPCGRRGSPGCAASSRPRFSHTPVRCRLPSSAPGPFDAELRVDRVRVEGHRAVAGDGHVAGVARGGEVEVRLGVRRTRPIAGLAVGAAIYPLAGSYSASAGFAARPTLDSVRWLGEAIARRSRRDPLDAGHRSAASRRSSRRPEPTTTRSGAAAFRSSPGSRRCSAGSGMRSNGTIARAIAGTMCTRSTPPRACLRRGGCSTAIACDTSSPGASRSATTPQRHSQSSRDSAPPCSFTAIRRCIASPIRRDGEELGELEVRPSDDRFECLARPPGRCVARCRGPRRRVSPRRRRPSRRVPPGGPSSTAGPSVARGSRRHLVGAVTQHAGRLRLDVLGVVEVDVPAAGAGELDQQLAVHDGVRRRSRRATGVGRRCRRGSPAARLGARSR